MKNENKSNSFHQEFPIGILRLIPPTSFNLTRIVIENTSIVYLIRFIILYYIEFRTKSTLKSKFSKLIMPSSHNLSPRVGLNINFVKVHIVPLAMVFKLSLPHSIYIKPSNILVIYFSLLSIIPFFLPPPPYVSTELRGPWLSSFSASA